MIRGSATMVPTVFDRGSHHVTTFVVQQHDRVRLTRGVRRQAPTILSTQACE